MHGRNLPLVCAVILSVSVLLLWADRAQAYVGPGVDVTFIGYAMTLLVWALAAFSAILLWPIYALLGWIRRRNHKTEAPALLEAAPEEARAASPTDS